jgi:hypothetical protein
MNSMSVNDEYFFDLAMKVIACHASDAERMELDDLLARQPELKSEFERLQQDAKLTREVLPLLSTTEATAPELPAYARGRLQTKVREALGRPRLADKARLRTLRWRLVLGLAGATAVVILLTFSPFNRPTAPLIQVAMLDTAGASRGSEANELRLLQQTWGKARVNSFSSTEDLRVWQGNRSIGSADAAVRVVYDKAAGEVHVFGKWKGKSFDKTILVEQDLVSALKQAEAFIREQTDH